MKITVCPGARVESKFLNTSLRLYWNGCTHSQPHLPVWGASQMVFCRPSEFLFLFCTLPMWMMVFWSRVRRKNNICDTHPLTFFQTSSECISSPVKCRTSYRNRNKEIIIKHNVKEVSIFHRCHWDLYFVYWQRENSY